MQLDGILLANLAPQIVSGIVLFSISTFGVASMIVNTKKNREVQNEINDNAKQR